MKFQPSQPAMNEDKKGNLRLIIDDSLQFNCIYPNGFVVRTRLSFDQNLQS